MSCWVCTQPLSEVWASTTRIVVSKVERLLLLLFYWWVTGRGRWQLHICHWSSRGFWDLESNWQYIKVGLFRKYCPLFGRELECGSPGGRRGELVCGSLDDRWQSRHLSPSYAPHVVLPAQSAAISQRLPRGKPPRREGKSGVKPCSGQWAFHFYPDG